MVHLLHLDTPFSSEEIDRVLHNLKPGKSAGYGLEPEHLKYGGAALSLWIRQVVNAFECVPELGIVIPLYKGGGKDPLDTNSYRGITLSPVLAKVVESLCGCVMCSQRMGYPMSIRLRKFLVLKPSSLLWR